MKRETMIKTATGEEVEVVDGCVVRTRPRVDWVKVTVAVTTTRIVVVEIPKTEAEALKKQSTASFDEEIPGASETLDRLTAEAMEKGSEEWDATTIEEVDGPTLWDEQG